MNTGGLRPLLCLGIGGRLLQTAHRLHDSVAAEYIKNRDLMRQQKVGARAEFRQQESQRVNDSSSLAEKFPQLRSLTVDLAYYSAEGGARSSEIKYTVNLANAKSVFRFDCPNSECVRGDFDLSDELTRAVATRRTTATGEKCCQGWLSKTTIGTIQCRNILRYKLSLGY